MAIESWTRFAQFPYPFEQAVGVLDVANVDLGQLSPAAAEDLESLIAIKDLLA